MCDIREKLIAKGVPYQEVMERFVNDEGFYFDFLHQFTQDEYIDVLAQALTEKDAENAFKAAHTLKGLMGNLGLIFLVEDISPLVEILRKGTVQGTENLFVSFQKHHQEFCAFIEENVPSFSFHSQK